MPKRIDPTKRALDAVLRALDRLPAEQRSSVLVNAGYIIERSNNGGTLAPKRERKKKATPTSSPDRDLQDTVRQ